MNHIQPDRDVNGWGPRDQPDDSKIENRYFRLTLLFLYASPVLVWQLMKHPLDINVKNLLYFPLVAFLSIPAVIILEILLRWVLDRDNPPKVWIKQPSVRMEINFGQNFDDWLKPFAARLNRLGFLLNRDHESGVFTLSKPKSKSGVHLFLDHRFNGSLTARKTNFGWTGQLELVMDDILLVETGETIKLKALADYLAGLAAEPTIRDVHLVMLNGLICGVALHVLIYLRLSGLADLTFLVLPCALAAVLLVLAALLIMSLNADKYVGYRLAVNTLVLAATPFLPYLIRLILE